MSPKRLAVEIITERLRMIEESLVHLQLLSGRAVVELESAPLERAAAERLLQVVVDLAIDINGHLLVALDHPAPATGRESFIEMGRAGVIDDDLAALLAPSASLRNVLVHRYVDIIVARVVDAIGMTERLYPLYIAQVARFLQALPQ